MRRQELLERRTSDAGMTLIELTIVMFVMAIVLVVAGTTVFSLTQTANRTHAQVTDEQEASTVLAQLSRDIRSAHQITFVAFASPVPTMEIELQMNQPPGTWIEWVYTPTATTVNGINQPGHTLNRFAATSASGPFGLSNPTVTTPVNVVNGATTDVFRYFQGNGSEITTIDSASSLQTCTTRVLVNLQAAQNLSAVSTFQVGADVAITDQELQWGSLPCS